MRNIGLLPVNELKVFRDVANQMCRIGKRKNRRTFDDEIFHDRMAQHLGVGGSEGEAAKYKRVLWFLVRHGRNAHNPTIHRITISLISLPAVLPQFGGTWHKTFYAYWSGPQTSCYRVLMTCSSI